MTVRHTKIVATIGPASNEPDILQRLVEHVDVFRLNFSHGTHDQHREMVKRIREACRQQQREVALLQDLCGPKIRTGEMTGGAIELVDGSEVIVTNEEVEGTSECFTSQYHELPRDVAVGDRIFLDDGKLEITVTGKRDANSVVCSVIHGGTLKNRKGMNLPDTAMSVPSVTDKDWKDLEVGLELGVDFVALSFVRHPEDIRQVKDRIREKKATSRVIAKIEKPEAVAAIDEIIEVTDGIMVARGDLGVEMDAAEVPFLQKTIIRKANAADRYVITATQMLESMIENARATRAEVGDVTTAILDGTDAVMLSGETAAGRFPELAVQTMRHIAAKTEAYIRDQESVGWDWMHINEGSAILDALGNASQRISGDLDLKAICTYSPSGGTGLYISKSRPLCPIVVFTRDPEAMRRMRLFWGVDPILDDEVGNRMELKKEAFRVVLEKGIAAEGDLILLITRDDYDHIGSQNSLEIARVTRQG